MQKCQALHLAAHHDNVDDNGSRLRNRRKIVQLLLDAGAEPEAKQADVSKAKFGQRRPLSLLPKSSSAVSKRSH